MRSTLSLYIKEEPKEEEKDHEGIPDPVADANADADTDTGEMTAIRCLDAWGKRLTGIRGNQDLIKAVAYVP